MSQLKLSNEWINSYSGEQTLAFAQSSAASEESDDGHQSTSNQQNVNSRHVRNQVGHKCVRFTVDFNRPSQEPNSQRQHAHTGQLVTKITKKKKMINYR